MYMRPRYLMLLVCVFSLLLVRASYGQQTYILHGRVLDELGDGLPLANLSVNGQPAATSDTSGQYRLRLDQLPAEITCTYIGYKAKSVYLTRESFQARQDQSFALHFRMQPDVHDLSVVTVSAPRIRVLHDDAAEYVIDFEFVDERMVLLIKSGKDYLVRLTDGADQPLQELAIDFVPDRLHKSCLGGIHVVGEQTCRELLFRGETVDSSIAYPKRIFRQLIEPCVAFTGGAYVLKRHYGFNQQVRYVRFDSLQGRPVLLAEISDMRTATLAEGMIGNIIASLKNAPNASAIYIDGMFYDEPGFERNLWNRFLSWNPEDGISFMHQLMLSGGLDQAIMQLKNWYLQPVYAPAFAIRDSLFLYDFQEHRVHIFTDSLRSCEVYGQGLGQLKSWKKDMYLDQLYMRLYTRLWEKGQWTFHEISPATGEIRRSSPAEPKHKYIRNYKIRDGYVYYLARPNAVSNYDRLFRISLY